MELIFLCVIDFFVKLKWVYRLSNQYQETVVLSRGSTAPVVWARGVCGSCQVKWPGLVGGGYRHQPLRSSGWHRNRKRFICSMLYCLNSNSYRLFPSEEECLNTGLRDMPPKHRACHLGLTLTQSQATEQQRPRPYEFESSLDFLIQLYVNMVLLSSPCILNSDGS